MAFFYWLSKFSHEAILIEVFCIALIGVLYFGYLISSRRKFGAGKRQIPDHIIKAFLIQQISQAEGFKNQLFGEDFKITGHPGGGPSIQILGASPMQTASYNANVGASAGGASSADLLALQGELGQSRMRQDELQKNISALAKEKADLEARLAEAQKAGDGKGAPAATGDSKALQDKISQLESKLSEYEVIEDDLANLKKYMQENKQLKAQLEALKGGAGAAVAAQPSVAPSAPAPAAVAAQAPAAPSTPAPSAPAEAAPVAEPVAAAPSEPKQDLAKADEVATELKAADALADKVEESLPTPAPSGASAVDPASLAAAQTVAPVVEVAASKPADDSSAGSASSAPKQDKSDADLLNEFERMLSS